MTVVDIKHMVVLQIIFHLASPTKIGNQKVFFK